MVLRAVDGKFYYGHPGDLSRIFVVGTTLWAVLICRLRLAFVYLITEIIECKYKAPYFNLATAETDRR